MKVAVLFDGLSALGKSPDVQILDTIEAVEVALTSAGNQALRVAVTPDGRWVERVRRGKFDLVFNLCEGIDGVGALEPAVISALELMGVPYSGASSYTAAICLRKHVINGLLDRAGLPVPAFGVVTPGSPLPAVGFPAICKPAAEDASIGIEQRSVARNVRSLAARVDAMHSRWDELLVQRYIDGREVNVGILGETALPIAEIDFAGMPKGMWRIVSYKSKWVTGCDEDLGSVPHCPADLSPELAQELRRIALTAWRTVGGQGYGRIDFRIDANGKPWLLEVNANPDLAPDAGLARMAAVAGLDYAALVHAICENALVRSREVNRTADRWLVAQHLSGEPLASDPALLDLFAAGGER
jgi:D-alanine-D-alanine ligase